MFAICLSDTVRQVRAELAGGARPRLLVRKPAAGEPRRLRAAAVAAGRGTGERPKKVS
jgi:hypothetical protein